MSIRKYLGLVAVVAAHRAAVAQLGSVPLPGARFGVTAGLNLARFAGDGLGPIANRTGLVGGISFVTPFAVNFATQLEGLYAMKGVRSLRSTPGDAVTFKIDYVEVPLMVRATAPMASRLRPFGYTGPAFGFRIDCGADLTFGGETQTEDCAALENSFSPGNTFRSFDFGWVAGAGLELPVGERLFTLSARYELGMRGLAESSTTKNRVLSFVVSVEAALPKQTRR